jgi:hypothetical protein
MNLVIRELHGVVGKNDGVPHMGVSEALSTSPIIHGAVPRGEGGKADEQEDNKDHGKRKSVEGMIRV